MKTDRLLPDSSRRVCNLPERSEGKQHWFSVWHEFYLFHSFPSSAMQDPWLIQSDSILLGYLGYTQKNSMKSVDT